MKQKQFVISQEQLEQTEQTSWFRPYIRPNLWRFVVIAALSTLTLAAAAALMFTSGYLISKSAMQPYNILMVYVPVVLVRTFGISRAAIHYLERLVSHDTILRILSTMRVRLYRILEPQALFIRSTFRTGDMLSVLADDIEQLQNVYLRTIFPTIAGLILFAAGTIALGAFDLPFALLIALHLVILIFVLPVISLVVMKRNHQKSKQQRNELYQKLTDAVLGISDWMISGRSKQFAQSYEQEEQHLAEIERSISRWARWRTLISQGIVGIVAVLVAVWAGGQSLKGVFEPVWIASFVLVVFPWMDAFTPVSEAIENVPRYQDSVERLQRIQQQHQRQIQRNDQKGAGSSFNARSAEALEDGKNQAGNEHKPHAHIQLNDVYFSYENVEGNEHQEESSWHIQGISLEIPQGHTIALIGRSGAGKSTLAKLVQGALVPQAGEVLINGMRAAEYGDHISRYIAVLNQSPHLFDTTVASNLRLGKPTATDEEIRRVAGQVQLDQLIESLPDGYQTPMLEAGSRFSGGERQRIALARILLQDTPVVLLDEPTIGLDPPTEKALLRTIFQTLQGKTLIWITHHLIGVEEMDEIIWMDQGAIKLRGNHEELLANQPYYRKLYTLDRPHLAI